MPKTELHKLAESDTIDQHNIKIHLKDLNTVNEEPDSSDYDYPAGGWGKTTPLHVAVLQSKRKAVLFLISYGADINLQFFDFLRRGNTAWSYSSQYRKDLLPIVTGGADNAKKILISEGFLIDEKTEEEEKKC